MTDLKIKAIEVEKVIKYGAVAFAVLILISSISIIALGIRAGVKSKEISALQEELAREQAVYEEKAAAYDKLVEEHSSEAASYADELNSQKETIDKLNKKIKDLNKQLSLKGESTTKKENSKPKPKPVMPDPIPSKGTTVYLTFDDGPSLYTSDILDILDEYGVKATFFVVNGKNNSVMKDIVNRGHKIGLHCYRHVYSEIYASDEAYFKDLQKIADVVKKETGVDADIIRFPGGGSNTISKKYSKGIMSRLTKNVVKKGYAYFDWNCSNGDADGAKTVEQQLQNCSQFPKGAKNVVVLMHDNKEATLKALPKIIEYYKSCEMTFGVLEKDTSFTNHKVFN